MYQLWYYQLRIDSNEIKCIETENLVFGRTHWISIQNADDHQLEYKIYFRLQFKFNNGIASSSVTCTFAIQIRT